MKNPSWILITCCCAALGTGYAQEGEGTATICPEEVLSGGDADSKNDGTAPSFRLFEKCECGCPGKGKK